MNPKENYVKNYNGPVEKRSLCLPFHSTDVGGEVRENLCQRWRSARRGRGGSVSITTLATVFEIPKLFFIDACRGSKHIISALQYMNR